MNSTNHIINKIIVNAKGINMDNVFGWRNQLSEFLTHDLPRQLQHTLDECCPEDRVLAIDKLNINVNVHPWDNMQLIEREILLSIQKELLEYKFRNSIKSAGIAKDQNVETKQYVIQLIDAWIYYLENGFYPWYLQQGISDHQFDNNITDEVFDYLLAKCREVFEKKIAVNRFLLTTSIRKVQTLLRVFYGHTVADRIAKKVLQRKTEGSFGQLLQKTAIVKIIVEKQEISEWSLQHTVEKLRTLINEEHPNKKNLAALFVEYCDPVLTQENTSLETNKEVIGKKKNNAVQDQKEIWILNGGIVLVHPFLKPLFAALSVIDSKDKIQDEVKALAVLHYILYEEAPYSDDQMLLPKILCGLDYDKPVMVDMELNSSEKQECNEMLQSVIWHWSALKKTSIEGLRSTFLFRKAKMLTTATGWKLMIESQTEDILLGRLPWSISIIKHPWMKGVVATEWN